MSKKPSSPVQSLL